MNLILKARWLRAAIILSLQYVVKFFCPLNHPVKNVLLYPSFCDDDSLSDYLHRIQWAIPRENLVNIYVMIFSKNEHTGCVNPSLHQKRYPGKKHTVIFIDGGKKKLRQKEYDRIFIHKTLSVFNFKILLNLNKVSVVDKFFFSTQESRLWQRFYTTEVVPQKKIQNSMRTSIDLYNSLKDKNFVNSYCFTTGPSFVEYSKNPAIKKESLTIVCNSVIKNKSFLEHIGGPDILVFADPVFHFGPNEYAAKFLESVEETLRDYPKTVVCVPEYSLFSLLHRYTSMKGRVIGMPIIKKALSKGFNFPTEKSFYVKGTNNILTLLMIPLASSLSKQVSIVGADGRKKHEKYFWKHGTTVQFHEKMESAKIAHPSYFFDRDYSKYYKKHCSILGAIIQYGESKGNIYTSLTQTYIPSLKDRMQLPQEEVWP